MNDTDEYGVWDVVPNSGACIIRILKTPAADFKEKVRHTGKTLTAAEIAALPLAEVL